MTATLVEARSMDEALNFQPPPAAPIALRADDLPPVPRHFFDVTPEAQVAMMTHVANVAKHVIEDRGWFMEFTRKGKTSRHVEIEGWQFIGSLMRCTGSVVSSGPVEDGYEAHAVIVRADTGVQVSSGDGMCTRDEENWRSREPFALRGMASTRAESRAFRHIFGFIAELAGYSPTPAAEMTAKMGDDDKKPPRASNLPPQPTRPEREHAPRAAVKAEEHVMLLNRFMALKMGSNKEAFVAWIHANFEDTKSVTGLGDLKKRPALITAIDAELTVVEKNEKAAE